MSRTAACNCVWITPIMLCCKCFHVLSKCLAQRLVIAYGLRPRLFLLINGVHTLFTIYRLFTRAVCARTRGKYTHTLHIANMFYELGGFTFGLPPLRCVAKVSMYNLTVSIAQRKLNGMLNCGAKRPLGVF